MEANKATIWETFSFIIVDDAQTIIILKNYSIFRIVQACITLLVLFKDIFVMVVNHFECCFGDDVVTFKAPDVFRGEVPVVFEIDVLQVGHGLMASDDIEVIAGAIGGEQVEGVEL